MKLNRSGEITEAEVQQMLHMASRWDVEAFLKRAQAYLDYGAADLERDIAAIRQVSPVPSGPQDRYPLLF